MVNVLCVHCRFSFCTYFIFFFFNDTATTEIYTLSLHDALPIWGVTNDREREAGPGRRTESRRHVQSEHVRPLRAVAHDRHRDRKSTRLNSSHANISYAVFCLKKKHK